MPPSYRSDQICSVSVYHMITLFSIGNILHPFDIMNAEIIPKVKEMTAFFRMRSLLCWHYLFSRLGQSIVLPQQVSGGHLQAKKNLLLS